MDKEIKKYSKAKVLYELDRLARLTKSTEKNSSTVKEKKKPDYNIFEKPKSKKAEDYFSLEFLEELKDYINDPKAKKTLMKMIKNKTESDSSSSDDED